MIRNFQISLTFKSVVLVLNLLFFLHLNFSLYYYYSEFFFLNSIFLDKNLLTYDCLHSKQMSLPIPSAINDNKILILFLYDCLESSDLFSCCDLCIPNSLRIFSIAMKSCKFFSLICHYYHLSPLITLRFYHLLPRNLSVFIQLNLKNWYPSLL